MATLPKLIISDLFLANIRLLHHYYSCIVVVVTATIWQIVFCTTLNSGLRWLCYRTCALSCDC